MKEWFGGLSKCEDRNFFLMAFATVDLVNLTLLPVMGFEFIDI